MVSLAEFRDECAGNHIRRTQTDVRLLAEYLSKQERGREFLSAEHIDQIARPLHDIGKTVIPHPVFLKPGEFAIMKTHAVKGVSILAQTRHELGEGDKMLFFASQIARNHHERRDGSGYPDQLAGEGIPPHGQADGGGRCL